MEFVDSALLELDAEKLQRACFKNKVRIDGRGFLQHRRVTVQPSYLKAPHIVGSALVQIGGTMCVAGVNIMVGVPSPEAPSCGDVVTLVALMAPGGGVALGTGGSSFGTSVSSAIGDPHRGMVEGASAQAEEAVAHAVRGLLDLGQLSILRGRFAYRLCVDVTCLCDEGGLDEAAVLAAVSPRMAYGVWRMINCV
jgi:exosome complex RNA-binding protein Rrp42 (RNase PH superfamily)